MSPATITLLFLLFAIVMFVWEKIPLGVTSMIICVGLVVTGVLDWKTAFAGFIDSNVILFVAMFIVGGALFETGMANKIGGVVTHFAKTERQLLFPFSGTPYEIPWEIVTIGKALEYKCSSFRSIIFCRSAAAFAYTSSALAPA